MLREAIWAAASARARRKAPPRSALRFINRAAENPLPVPQLALVTMERTLVARDAFHGALSAIARDAIERLGGAAARRIKACSQPGCCMLFFDASPAQRRRWCSMGRCGSRAKGLTARLKRRSPSRPPEGAPGRQAKGRRR